MSGSTADEVVTKATGDGSEVVETVTTLETAKSSLRILGFYLIGFQVGIGWFNCSSAIVFVYLRELIPANKVSVHSRSVGRLG